MLVLGRLGLVLTHGQAAALAAKHHGDYEHFLATLGDSRRRPQKVVVVVVEGGSCPGFQLSLTADISVEIYCFDL